MDSPDAPQVPDPKVIAAEQGKLNSDAARLNAVLNRPNQVTPFGSLTWEQGAPTRTFNQQRYDDAVRSAQNFANASSNVEGQFGDVIEWVIDPERGPMPTVRGRSAPIPTASMPDRNDPRFFDTTNSDQWTSKITLDPRVQGLLDSQLQTSQNLQHSIDNSLGQVNQMFAKPAPTADAGVRQSVEDALYQRYKSRLDPEFQQGRDRLRSDLINRGIFENNPAYDKLIDSYGRQENDAYDQARTSSILTGGNEMARQLALEQQARMGTVNELNALRSGAQAQLPTFMNGNSGAVVNPAPYAQSAYNSYQGQLGQYSADVAGQNSMMSGLFGLGAAGLGTGAFNPLLSGAAAGLGGLFGGGGAAAGGAAAGGVISDFLPLLFLA